jgi:hypothetical protein
LIVDELELLEELELCDEVLLFNVLEELDELED